MRAFPLAVVLFALAGCLAWAQEEAEPAAGDGAGAAEGRERSAVVIPLRGPITPMLGAFIERKLDEALEGPAELIVLDIDSPGGYVSTTLELAERMAGIAQTLREPAPQVVAVIPREALSGAAIIALACDQVLIGSRARLGDAGPVVLGPDAAFRHAPEKFRSNLAQQLRDIARAKGRPAALAEAMVDKDLVVFEAIHQEEGRREFFTEPEWESLADADDWQRGRPVFETRQGTFLTVNGARAVELGLADGTAESLDAALDHLGAKRPVRVLSPTWVDTLVTVLNIPWITGLVLVIGLVALLMELSAPGMSLGGLVAMLCFGLFFWSRFLGGTSGWLEVVLFVCGLVFIAAELFVLPGFGIAGLSGGALVLTSLVMASQRAVLPESPRDLTQLGVNVLTIGLALGAVLVAAILLSERLGQLPVLRRLMLAPPEGGAPELADLPADALAGLPAWQRVELGEQGTSISPLRPAGKAQFGETLVDVVTEGDFLEVGQRVRVILKQGARVVVRRV